MSDTRNERFDDNPPDDNPAPGFLQRAFEARRSGDTMSDPKPVSARDDFLRRFDELIKLAEARPFKGQRRALSALKQVRQQRSLG